MSFKTIILIILFILFVVFVLQNIETITVHFLMYRISMPRALLLTINLVVGFIIGVFIPYEFKKSKSKPKT